jgi:hypothetical protein
MPSRTGASDTKRDSDLSTCCVGVSFYRTADGDELHTARSMSDRALATSTRTSPLS